MPLSQLSICKMKNNGIPLPSRNAINALRLVKNLLFRDGECKSIESRMPCEKIFFAIEEFSIAFILVWQSVLAYSVLVPEILDRSAFLFIYFS